MGRLADVELQPHLPLSPDAIPDSQLTLHARALLGAGNDLRPAWLLGGTLIPSLGLRASAFNGDDVRDRIAALQAGGRLCELCTFPLLSSKSDLRLHGDGGNDVCVGGPGGFRGLSPLAASLQAIRRAAAASPTDGLPRNRSRDRRGDGADHLPTVQAAVGASRSFRRIVASRGRACGRLAAVDGPALTAAGERVRRVRRRVL